MEAKVKACPLYVSHCSANREGPTFSIAVAAITMPSYCSCIRKTLRAFASWDIWFWDAIERPMRHAWYSWLDIFLQVCFAIVIENTSTQPHPLSISVPGDSQQAVHLLTDDFVVQWESVVFLFLARSLYVSGRGPSLYSSICSWLVWMLVRWM